MHPETIQSSVYRGQVSHWRRGDVEHFFAYDLCMFALDLDELDRLAGELRLFSRNRRGLFAFYDADHGRFLEETATGRGANLRASITRFTRDSVDFEPARILLVTQVRLLGYVFNPVCFYYLYDENDNLRFVLVEVNNTFGVQAAYLLEHEAGLAGASPRAPKILHVSPFLEADIDFVFAYDPPGEELRMRIDSVRAGAEHREAPRLRAMLQGEQQPLGDGLLARIFIRFPLATLQVIIRIHWQALRLWMKGAPFRTMDAVHARIAERLGSRPVWRSVLLKLSRK